MKPCNESEIVGLNATYRKYYLKGYEAAEKEHNHHLKKIRAEIEQKARLNEIGGRGNGKSIKYGLCLALEIIDKYSVGSEVEDRNDD